MDLFTGFIVYFIIWWTVIFCILPFGVRRNTDAFEGSGAPAAPGLRKKFLLTTIISALIWIALYILIRMDVIDFLKISSTMMEAGRGT